MFGATKIFYPAMRMHKNKGMENRYPNGSSVPVYYPTTLKNVTVWATLRRK